MAAHPLTTLIIGKEGNTQSVTESYQLVDDILVVSGEEDGQKYVVDGKLSIQDDTFVYVTPTYRVTGEKVD